MTRDPVLSALGRVARAAAKAEATARARDEAIRLAHADGATIRAIAGVAELSPARVHQILHGR